MNDNNTIKPIILKYSKAEEVSEYIKDGLLAGLWKPEERINDLELSNKLGVSRSSVREALAKLAESNIIEKIQWKGYYVKTLSIQEIESIVELRKSIEKIAIKNVCKQNNPRLYNQMREVINKSEQALNEKDLLSFLKIDFNFHELLYEGSGNPYLKNAISNLIFNINIMRNLSMGGINEHHSASAASVEDHRNILTAMEEGDTERADMLMDAHLDDHLANIYKSLTSVTSGNFHLESAIEMEMVLGESPIWYAEKDLLIWLDIRRGILYSAEKNSRIPRILYQGDHIGGLTLQSTGDLLLFFNNGAIGSFSLENRILKPLPVQFPEDMESAYFNDAIADPEGRVFLGSIASRNLQGALYRIDTDGTMKKMISDVPISNGMGFSPDNSYFYHTDSSRHVINRYNYNIKTGEIENKTLFYQVDTSIEPDGLTVDSEGNIIAALWNGSALMFIDPDGRRINKVEIPALNVTNVCFAGRELKTLYITSAGGENRIRNGELAGSIFKLNLTIAGKAEFRSRILC